MECETEVGNGRLRAVFWRLQRLQAHPELPSASIITDSSNTQSDLQQFHRQCSGSSDLHLNLLSNKPRVCYLREMYEHTVLKDIRCIWRTSSAV